MNDAQDAAETTDQSWFSVRCIFGSNDEASTLYEERIALWRAESFEVVVSLAEAEAAEYADLVGSSYLGFAQAYQLADEPGHGAEVYSLMRDSDLPPVYLTAHGRLRAEAQAVTSGLPVVITEKPTATLVRAGPAGWRGRSFRRPVDQRYR